MQVMVANKTMFLFVNGERYCLFPIPCIRRNWLKSIRL